MLLLEWLAAGKDLLLDLERAESIDVAVLQLLWVAGREAARAGVGVVSSVSAAVACIAREAGFPRLPGAPVQV